MGIHCFAFSTLTQAQIDGLAPRGHGVAPNARQLADVRFPANAEGDRYRVAQRGTTWHQLIQDSRESAQRTAVAHGVELPRRPKPLLLVDFSAFKFAVAAVIGSGAGQPWADLEDAAKAVRGFLDFFHKLGVVLEFVHEGTHDAKSVEARSARLQDRIGTARDLYRLFSSARDPRSSGSENTGVAPALFDCITDIVHRYAIRHPKRARAIIAPVPEADQWLVHRHVTAFTAGWASLGVLSTDLDIACISGGRLLNLASCRDQLLSKRRARRGGRRNKRDVAGSLLVVEHAHVVSDLAAVYPQLDDPHRFTLLVAVLGKDFLESADRAAVLTTWRVPVLVPPHGDGVPTELPDLCMTVCASTAQQLLEVLPEELRQKVEAAYRFYAGGLDEAGERHRTRLAEAASFATHAMAAAVTALAAAGEDAAARAGHGGAAVAAAAADDAPEGDDGGAADDDAAASDAASAAGAADHDAAASDAASATGAADHDDAASDAASAAGALAADEALLLRDAVLAATAGAVDAAAEARAAAASLAGAQVLAVCQHLMVGARVILPSPIPRGQASAPLVAASRRLARAAPADLHAVAVLEQEEVAARMQRDWPLDRLWFLPTSDDVAAIARAVNMTTCGMLSEAALPDGSVHVVSLAALQLATPLNSLHASDGRPPGYLLPALSLGFRERVLQAMHAVLCPANPVFVHVPTDDDAELVPQHLAVLDGVLPADGTHPWQLPLAARETLWLHTALRCAGVADALQRERVAGHLQAFHVPAQMCALALLAMHSAGGHAHEDYFVLVAHAMAVGMDDLPSSLRAPASGYPQGPPPKPRGLALEPFAAPLPMAMQAGAWAHLDLVARLREVLLLPRSGATPLQLLYFPLLASSGRYPDRLKGAGNDAGQRRSACTKVARWLLAVARGSLPQPETPSP